MRPPPPAGGRACAGGPRDAGSWHGGCAPVAAVGLAGVGGGGRRGRGARRSDAWRQVRSRKLRSSVSPCSAAIDSGWNWTPKRGPERIGQAHHHAVVRPGGLHERRQGHGAPRASGSGRRRNPVGSSRRAPSRRGRPGSTGRAPARRLRRPAHPQRRPGPDGRGTLQATGPSRARARPRRSRNRGCGRDGPAPATGRCCRTTTTATSSQLRSSLRTTSGSASLICANN